MLDWLATWANNSWPVLAAIALVGIIVYGALSAGIRADKRKRRAQQETTDE